MQGNSPIRPIPVFLCSPHSGGVTDSLGGAAAAGLAGAGANAQVIRLCARQIRPCLGCGTCLQNGGNCLLPHDAAEDWFGAIQGASALLFAAPVYFYALPGQFKVFIDRSQKFWHVQPGEISRPRPAGVIMAAARKQGEKLFSGSLLTLRWFLKPFGFAIAHTLLLRGLETAADISPPDLDAAYDMGVDLATAAKESR